MLEGGSWEIFFSSPLTMTSLDHVKEKKKKKKERSANWLANSPQTNGQLMTLVAAAAQGLLMKPPDQSLLFKTWKLTDHWTGILGLQATVNLLCETNSAPKPSCCQDTLTHTHSQYVHAAHLNLLLAVLQLTLILSTAHSHTSMPHPTWTLPQTHM